YCLRFLADLIPKVLPLPSRHGSGGGQSRLTGEAEQQTDPCLMTYTLVMVTNKAVKAATNRNRCGVRFCPCKSRSRRFKTAK
ncbi:MAG: hypothetical protein ACYS14_11400, partial [Planctomycetota bacterium]